MLLFSVSLKTLNLELSKDDLIQLIINSQMIGYIHCLMKFV